MDQAIVTDNWPQRSGLVKVAHDFQDARIQPDVFDSASTGIITAS